MDPDQSEEHVEAARIDQGHVVPAVAEDAAVGVRVGRELAQRALDDAAGPALQLGAELADGVDASRVPGRHDRGQLIREEGANPLDRVLRLRTPDAEGGGRVVHVSTPLPQEHAVRKMGTEARHSFSPGVPMLCGAPGRPGSVLNPGDIFQKTRWTR